MALSLSPKVTLAVVAIPANVGDAVVTKLWLIALTAARLVSSLSINAPAEVTLAVSVTSALVSTVSSLVPSVATSRPSKVLLVVTAPVRTPPAFGKAALAVVVVDVNTASLVATSTPSKVLLVVIGPVIAPPAKGSFVESVVESVAQDNTPDPLVFKN